MTSASGHGPDTDRAARRTHAWQLPGLLALSVGFESLFVFHGMALLDEGWAIRGAQGLHAGGALYRDVFLPFPPGHLLPAWIGYWIDPPGVIAARAIDAAFNVALCAALYALGRRLMPAGYALLGAGLLAVAAPASHVSHYLFGYRYLVFSALALIALARRIDSGERRWLLVAGVWTGVALCFRLTPAAAVGCGIGVSIFAIGRDWRGWIADAARYALGIGSVCAPVLLWFAAGVGLDVVWNEVVVRPAAMTALQSLPVPSLVFPTQWSRSAISHWWLALQFRLYAALYAGYLLALVALWVRALARQRRFDHALLLAVTTWGAVYFTRALGRSDGAHLESAIPPVCLLIAHLAYLTGGAWPRVAPRAASALRVASGCALFAAWVFLFGSDRYLPVERRGTHPVQAGSSTWSIRSQGLANVLRDSVGAIRELTGPDDAIFDLSVAPLFHVMADRPGLAVSGIVIPGTFLSPQEELATLERLREAPPALVVASLRHFDNTRSRSIEVIAPQITYWIGHHYQVDRQFAKYVIMTPKPELRPGPSSR